MTSTIAIITGNRTLGDALRSSKQLLERFDVVALATELDDILPLLAASPPRLVLLGDDTDGPDPVAITQAILREAPDTAILLMSSEDRSTHLARAVESGVAGYVHESRGLTAIIDALIAVEGGATAFERTDLRWVVDLLHPVNTSLTPSARQVDVLRRLSEGSNVTSIAEDLDLSEHTIRNHLRNVMDKLGVSTQLAAVMAAMREGLIDLPAE